MIVKFIWFILAIGFASPVQAIDNNVKSFFKSGPNKGANLPADQLYPRGKLFPFSFYSIGGGNEQKSGDLSSPAMIDADQKYIADAGITMIGPQYELNDSIISDAKRLGKKAFFTVNPSIKGELITRDYLKKLVMENSELDREALRTSIKNIVEVAAQNPEIAWWNLTPEELRYWVKLEHEYLQFVAEAIREFDPLKRPVFMYEPNHRSAAELAKDALFIDVIGKGMYVNYSGMKNSRIWCRWTIEQEIQAIAQSGRDGLLAIAIPEMFESPEQREIDKIPAWARHDTYLSLVSGAKGVIVFSARKRPNFSIARNKYLEAYLAICRELTGPQGLGQVFLFGESKGDLELSVINGPEKVLLKLKDGTIFYPSVAMANLDYLECRYIFLVNSSDAKVDIVVGGLPYGTGLTVENLFKVDEKFIVPEGDFTISLQSLDVKAYRIYNAK